MVRQIAQPATLVLQRFKKTGRHPALEGAADHVLPALPVRDPNRPHVFLSFRSGKADLGETCSRHTRTLLDKLRTIVQELLFTILRTATSTEVPSLGTAGIKS